MTKHSESVLYEAWDLRERRHVLLKMRDPSPDTAEGAFHALIHERNAFRELRHTGIALCTGLERVGTSAALILKHIRGISLPASGLAGTLPPDRFLKLAAGLAETLEAIHARGWICNGIVPGSMLIDQRRFQLKFIDLAYAFQADSSVRMNTPPSCDQDFFPRYASQAPELYGSTGRTPDCRSDLYSAGVLLYWLMTNHLPYDAADAVAWSDAVIAQPPVEIRRRRPDVPPPIAHIIHSMLSKRPVDRIQTALELKIRLYDALSRQESTEPAAGSKERQASQAPSRTTYSMHPHRPKKHTASDLQLHRRFDGSSAGRSAVVDQSEHMVYRLAEDLLEYTGANRAVIATERGGKLTHELTFDDSGRRSVTVCPLAGCGAALPGLVAAALEASKAILRDDADQDKRPSREDRDPSLREYGHSSAYAVPVAWDGKARAVLALERGGDASTFAAVDTGVLERLAGRLVSMLLLHRSIQEEMSVPAYSGEAAVSRADYLESLTGREREVLKLISAGLSNEEISVRLGVALGTIKVHTRNIFGKLNVKRRTQAVKIARELRWIEQWDG